MKAFKKGKLLFFVLLLAGIVPAKAQILGNLLDNIEVGYNLPWAWADNIHHDKFTSPINGMPVDTTATRKVHSLFGTRSKISLGATLATNLPITRLGRKSELALSIGVLFNQYYWGYDVASFGPGDVTDSGINYQYNLKFDGTTMYLAVPISLDFKFGCDAMPDKRYRWCWTGGVGVVPSYNKMTFEKNDPGLDPNYGAQPFLKTEVGWFKGVCWKVRAIYSFGDLTYYNQSSNASFVGAGETGLKLIGKSNLTVSLIVMPMSFTWKRSEWFNR